MIFFYEKNRTKKPGEKTEPGARFFPFPKEARPCLSRNHIRASRGSKTVTLVKRKKNRKRVFSLFERGTPVRLAKSQPCFSWKQNRDSRGKKKKQKTRFFPFLKEARP